VGCPPEVAPEVAAKTTGTQASRYQIERDGLFR
jgi:hypothetical protein